MAYGLLGQPWNLVSGLLSHPYAFSNCFASAGKAPAIVLAPEWARVRETQLQLLEYCSKQSHVDHQPFVEEWALHVEMAPKGLAFHYTQTF